MTKEWRYEPETKTIRSVPENHWIASMDSFDGAENHTTNARLIASAPQLYRALEKLYELACGEIVVPDELQAEVLGALATTDGVSL